MWQTEKIEVREMFVELAHQKKLEHARLHPGYTYCPRKPSEKKRRMTKKKLEAIKNGTVTPVSGVTALKINGQSVPRNMVEKVVQKSITGPNGDFDFDRYMDDKIAAVSDLFDFSMADFDEERLTLEPCTGYEYLEI